VACPAIVCMMAVTGVACDIWAGIVPHGLEQTRFGRSLRRTKVEIWSDTAQKEAAERFSSKKQSHR